ncbi:MAG TPA: hypothetical protein VFO85_18495, partial [Vicinamibacteria bacterium]|nr:hypothetical protein [Vicinamibacteria bacterium]
MKRSLPVLLALAVGVVLAHCHQALFTAPAGSTLDVTANPEFIPAHGGVSVITAVVIEPAGTPVADGTVVQFFTTLGRIDEQGRTNDGVARVNLLAQGLSGPAVVTAVSGGQTPAPSSSTSSTSSTTATTVPVSGNVSARAGGLAPLAGAANSDTVTVTIGSALPEHL